MTVINLYWALRADGDRRAGLMIEAARNTDPDTLDIIRGWVEQLAAQAVLHAGTTITVHGNTATIRQPRQPEPELTLNFQDWIIHAADRLLVVDDDVFHADYSATPPIHI
ncbi:hypothetical protein [Amycolatopsis sp. lyj-23]|uniref:hypothetical protein n=1 Tax=Amycolatopsis sp. lyj-23 TaxID=2789283 RepID=UPI00397C0937